MTKPYDRLNENNKKIVDDIRKISQDFTELNNENKKCRKLLSTNKKAYLVVSINLHSGRMSLDKFKNLIQIRSLAFESALGTYIEKYQVLINEINSVKEFMPLYVDLVGEMGAGKLAIALGVHLSDTETAIKLIIPKILGLNDDLKSMGDNISSQTNNAIRIEEITTTFNNVNDEFENIDLEIRNHMRVILEFRARLIRLLKVF